MIKKIGLGTWSWGNKLFWNYQTKSDEQLFEVFQEALKSGYSFIDTADSYGTGRLNGRSEYLLGKFLDQTPKSKKNKIQIATKLAPYPWRIGRNGFTLPYKKSLERLKNNLDIVQLHWSTSRYNPSQELSLLDNLVDLNEEGFEFKIGLSNIGPIKLLEIIDFLAKRNKTVHCVQVQFSLLAPKIDIQKKVKKICDENKINFLAYSPLSFGLLCKKPNSTRVNNTSLLRNLIFNVYEQSTLKLRQALFDIANQRSVSQAQVAINWCCYQGAIPLIGLRSRDQVTDIAGVLNWDLTKSEYYKLEEISRDIKRKLPSNPFISD